MDRKLVAQKLENLRNCVARIESKMPESADRLFVDLDIQDIISVNLERAVQNCIDIAAHLASDLDDLGGLSAGSLFLELGGKGIIEKSLAEKLSKAVGFRNLLVHRYATIEWGRVFEKITTEMCVFRDFALQIGKYCGL